MTPQDELNIGDWVKVHDPGLLGLYEIMKRLEPSAKPNNVGRISEIWDDDYLIEFPIGDDPIEEHSQVAPYPKGVVEAIAQVKENE